MSEKTTSKVPYPGLRAFQSDETHLFFGREEQTDELLARLEKHHFLAVIGASGCGKSSLVRAGLLNGLETGFMASAGSRWRFATMEPDDRPMENLAKAIAEATALDGDAPASVAPFLEAEFRRGPLGLVELLQNRPLFPRENLLLLVDQFEEIFRFIDDGGHEARDEAEAFVALLLETARAGGEGRVPIFVVITMRSEFLGHCAVFQGLPEVINEGQFLTPRMTREQKLKAIRGPARVFGGEVETELLNSLLNDMGPDSDQLPLMQHVLARTWETAAEETAEERSGPVLTLEDYQGVGGLKSALSKHLDEAFASLSPEQQGIAEVLFRGLSLRDSAGRDVRKPTTLGRLAAIAAVPVEEMAAVVDVFRETGSFIAPGINVPIDAETELDISHESLLRQWEQMRGWLENEAASAETYRRLAEEALEWNQGKAGLWSTPKLELALAWRDEQRPTAPWAERYFHRVKHKPGATTHEEMFELALLFLDASEKEQGRRRVRERRRLIGARIATAVFILLFVWAWHAQVETAVVKDSAAATLAAHEIATEHPEVALWLTLYAYHRQPNDIRNADHMYWALANLGLPAERTLPAIPSHGTESGVQSLAYDAAGTQLVTTRRKELWRWQLEGAMATGEMILAADTVLTTVAFSSAGVAFVGDEAGRVRRLDLRTGMTVDLSDASLAAEDLSPGPAHVRVVRAIALSPDGRLLATAGDDKLVKVWSVTGDSVTLYRTLRPNSAVRSVAFSPDTTAGYRLATGSEDRRVLVWDLDSGESQGVGGAKADFPRALAFGQRGQGAALETVLAHGDDQGFVALWRLKADGTSADSAAIWESKVSAARIRGLGFDSRGDQLAVASEDHLGYLLTLDPGFEIEETRPLRGHLGWVTSVEFSPDGRSLATGSMDGTAKLWRTRGSSSEPAAQRVLGGVSRHTNRLRGIAFSSTDALVATTSDDGTVALWDYSDRSVPPLLKSKQPIPMPDGTTLSRGVSVAFRHDGTQLAVASLEGYIATIWSVKDGTLAPVPVDTLFHKNWVWDVEFSPDDSLFATAGAEGLATFWRVRGDSLVWAFSLDGHDGRFVTDVTFSPRFAKDSLVATAGRDRTAVVWKLHAGGGTQKFRVRHLGDVRGVAFSPDGLTLATASDDKTVGLWNVQNGDSIGTLAHEDVVWGVAFDPSGSRLASSSYGGLIRLWNVESPRHPMMLGLEVRERSSEQMDRLGRVAFSPLQDVIGVGSWDSKGYLYEWKTEQVERTSWQRLTRAMTDVECEKYLSQPRCDAFFSVDPKDTTRLKAPFTHVRVRAFMPSGGPR